MPGPVTNSLRHRFALLTALATLALVGVGGLVTSHGVGMAVPDWPNTYGYNMFLFPVSKWIGGIFYEHSHRLVASAVGLLTTILALWFFGRSARPFMRWSGLGLITTGGVIVGVWPQRAADGLVLAGAGLVSLVSGFLWPRCEPSKRWLRRLGVIAFFAVVLQGVLGGLRVVLFKDQIGIAHAALAQLFFVLMCALALFTSRWWNELPEPALSGAAQRAPDPASRSRARWFRGLLIATTVLVLGQLVLGATMRHQHAGLAIPDFPLAYGKIWPPMEGASVARYNAQRLETIAMNPITPAQIALQMAHRALAMLILCAVAACAWLSRRWFGGKHVSSRLAMTWLGLIAIQVLLGAATIWSDKAADLATAHVVAGALTLALGAVLTIISYREPGLRMRASASIPAWADRSGVRSAAVSAVASGSGLSDSALSSNAFGGVAAGTAALRPFDQ